MIENNIQYEGAKNWVKEYEKMLKEIENKQIFLNIEREAVISTIEDLKQQINDYETEIKY